MNYVYLHFFFKSSKIFIQTVWQKHGQEELPLAQGQGQWPRGATPRLRSGVVARRSYPTSKEWWMGGHKRAERSYSMFKVSRGGCEEIPLVQGKEQRLRFAGAAVKRYPKSKRNPSRRNPSKMVGIMRDIKGQTHKP